LCIEEPEAHLHPHAQKALYEQVNEMPGQKIISTHSPFIAAQAELKELRSVIHHRDSVVIGSIAMDKIDSIAERKIKQKVIKTRGEMLFAKVLVFFEGETEELALPILAESYFGSSKMLTISFVGVGGYGSYAPFLRVAESLCIPWFVFSDNEKDAEKSVKKQIQEVDSNLNINERVVFLPPYQNFESYLLSENYQNEIKQAIIANCVFANEHHKCAREKEIQLYSDGDLLEHMTGNKTQMGAMVAEQIVNSPNGLPKKVTDLFDKVKGILGA
jgi:putative ATP-dependent endonuclease of OLD family